MTLRHGQDIFLPFFCHFEFFLQGLSAAKKELKNIFSAPFRCNYITTKTPKNQDFKAFRHSDILAFQIIDIRMKRLWGKGCRADTEMGLKYG